MAQTVARLKELIGKTGTIAGDGSIRFDVEIRDAKVGYGTDRVLITPITGSGEAWVNLARVQLDAAPKWGAVEAEDGGDGIIPPTSAPAIVRMAGEDDEER